MNKVAPNSLTIVMRVAWIRCLTFTLLSLNCNLVFAQLNNYYEKDGLVVIEAEHFVSQHQDDKRRWIVFSEDAVAHQYADNDSFHHDASGGQYIELLPDTRTNHQEKLLQDENFTNNPGTMAVISYPVYFSNSGTYYVWARAYSSGSEDNGIHLGLNGNWPETSQRLQLCQGKHQWTWSSAQRIKTNHCGTPNTITLEIPSPGVHTVMVSMREDGFELDKLLLTKNKDYQPQGADLPATLAIQSELSKKNTLLGISDYLRIFHATADFSAENDKTVTLYLNKKENAIAINSIDENSRNQYAYALTKLSNKEAGKRSITLVTLGEQTGASKYQVVLNDEVIGQFENPVASTHFQENYFSINNISLKNGDILKVGAMSVANANSSNKGKKVYSTGAWRALVISRENKE